jgi:hypothetical protein
MAEANKQNNSSIKSGCKNQEYADQFTKSEPPEKSVKEINKANSPRSRGKAPGSVRV